jgi:hypothetical protein
LNFHNDAEITPRRKLALRIASPNGPMSAAVQGEPHVRDIDIMANATKRSQDVADTHFFAPANVMKLF